MFTHFYLSFMVSKSAGVEVPVTISPDLPDAFFQQIWEGYSLYIPHDPTILYPNHYPNDIIIFPGQGHFSFLMVNSNMIEHQYCHLPYHSVSLYLSKV